MSFGGFSDIQRDRDRAHSSRHRNNEDGESGFSRWSAGTHRGRSETEEETEEESGHEEGPEDQQQQQQQHQPPRRQRGDPSPTEGNSYATNNPRGPVTTNGAGAGVGVGVGVGGINWGSAAETGIANLAKAYDKSASINKEAAGSNGAGKPNVFGQRLAEREEPESGAGTVMVKQAFGSGECALGSGFPPWWFELIGEGLQ
ncbi:hypothetical protein Q9L58_005045 [Maublancomyces gigas]|uniref:Uncharacterized protein n=1 Tax=Discina gigas TaxID=1032678 RepID=A0ABR3GJE7_9PEZI